MEEVAKKLSFSTDSEIDISFSQEISDLRDGDGSSDDAVNVCNEHISDSEVWAFDITV